MRATTTKSITYIMRSRAVSNGRIFTQYVGFHENGDSVMVSEGEVATMVASGTLYIDPTPVPLPAMLSLPRKVFGNLPEYAAAVRDAGGVVRNLNPEDED